MTTLSTHITIPMLPLQNTVAKNVVLAFLGSVLMAVCANISVPMFPVPMTLQTFAVLSVGMALGGRYGALSVAMYLAQGAMGLPVFAGGKMGLAVLMGGSAGYLWGFVVAAYVVGTLAERGWDRNFVMASVAMLLGNIVLYLPGLAWLGMVYGWDKPILAWGLTPFIIGDLVKLVLASALFTAVWKKLDSSAPAE